VTAFNVHGKLHAHVPELHERFMLVSQLMAGVAAASQVAPPRPTFKNIYFIISFKKFDLVFNSYGMMFPTYDKANSCIYMFLMSYPMSMVKSKYKFQLNL
jgi:hypothetical protein